MSEERAQALVGEADSLQGVHQDRPVFRGGDAAVDIILLFGSGIAFVAGFFP